MKDWMITPTEDIQAVYTQKAHKTNIFFLPIVVWHDFCSRYSV